MTAVAPPHATNLRSDERRRSLRIARIELGNGESVTCVVRDLSLAGAKLSVARRHRLPPRFQLTIPGNDLACDDLTCEVKLVWQRGDFAGVTIHL